MNVENKSKLKALYSREKLKGEFKIQSTVPPQNHVHPLGIFE